MGDYIRGYGCWREKEGNNTTEKNPIKFQTHRISPSPSEGEKKSFLDINKIVKTSLAGFSLPLGKKKSFFFFFYLEKEKEPNIPPRGRFIKLTLSPLQPDLAPPTTSFVEYQVDGAGGGCGGAI